MDYVYYILGILVLLALIAVVFSVMSRSVRPETDPLEKITSLIKQGILYEEEFVEVYFKVIRDEGFMENFGENKEEARQLLTTMIEESRGHKNLLENVMANLK
ncbi:MAG: hypothetical protein WC551_04420 [Patescibacteria group bacterium]